MAATFSLRVSLSHNAWLAAKENHIWLFWPCKYQNCWKSGWKMFFCVVRGWFSVSFAAGGHCLRRWGPSEVQHHHSGNCGAAALSHPTLHTGRIQVKSSFFHPKTDIFKVKIKSRLNAKSEIELQKHSVVVDFYCLSPWSPAGKIWADNDGGGRFAWNFPLGSCWKYQSLG